MKNPFDPTEEVLDDDVVDDDELELVSLNENAIELVSVKFSQESDDESEDDE